ncbi:PAS domain-containing protein [Candidatus Halobonum tyrrellensis]|uniref:histidine kinase n=1 Tax=Candidatus Halobonum tyrrellensis G22 TaxID=1324957 RepID=V4HL72_9EURY|nr:PAS domain-containing protein [Candidatus Halobonum tyrrellensis]ESP88674.1 multi-sensor signal transduction histidine kinase [Candidatus Halobonum tyrrellensis G22]
MTERTGPLRLLFVGVADAVAEGVTAALDRRVESTRVDAGADPAGVDPREYDCVVVAADAPTAWTERDAARGDGTSVPHVRVDGDEAAGADTETGAADRLAARVRAVTSVSREHRRSVERSAEDAHAVDADWRVVVWNSAVADRLDRPAASVLGEVVWEAFPELVGTRFEAEYRRAMGNGEARTVEARPVGFDVRVESRAYPDESGLTIYTRNAEEGRERARRLDRYEAAVEAIRDPVFVVDEERHVVFANASVRDTAPSDGDDDAGADDGNRSVRDLLGDAGERVEWAVDAALDAAGTIRAEGFDRQVVVTGAGGESGSGDGSGAAAGGADGRRSVEYRVTPFTSRGRAYALVAGRDVTERERERERTRTVAERFGTLTAAMPTPVVGVNAEGEVTLWNDAAEDTFGWSRSEVLGEFNPIVPESERADFEVNRRRLLDGERIDGQEVRRRARDGETLDLRLWGAPVRDGDGAGSDAPGTEVLAVFEDLTEQKHYHRRLRALQRATGGLNVASTRQEVADRAVEAAVEVLDMELTGLYGYDPEANALVPVASGAGTDETFDELPTFEAGEGLVWAAFEDGTPRVYEDVSAVEGRYNTDTPVRAELIVPLGEHGVLMTGSTDTRAFDETEVTMFRSLAAAVEAALTRADREQQLTRQNERLEEFSRVVAHDLRNPISVAEGFLELARETGDPDHFERVERALDRMARLVDDLLVLARRGDADRESEPVELTAAAREAWKHVETGAATLDADDLPSVTGDESRFVQLFENLFRNAVEHGGDGVTVRAGALDGGGFYVADDGAGIPDDDRDRVFEQGYTTRQDGTGFGLSIVETIAAAHDLRVAATEAADGGARFEFRPS